MRAARGVGYTGAGTVEFIVNGDQPNEFYFERGRPRLLRGSVTWARR